MLWMVKERNEKLGKMAREIVDMMLNEPEAHEEIGHLMEGYKKERDRAKGW